jgi:hypothetical protein
LKVVFYGLSTEGLRIAKALLPKHEVTVIDENLRMAIPLNLQMRALTPKQLIDQDLTPISSFSETLDKAEVIFFGPKVRKVGAEGRAELLIRLREMSRFLPSKALLIYLLPLSLREGRNVITLIEDQSGLREGEDFNFIYYPLGFDGNVQGFVGAPSESVPKVLEELIGKVEVLSLQEAGMRHFKNLIKGIMPNVIELSFPEMGSSSVYISEAVNGLLDTQLLGSSLPTSHPLFHLALALPKSIDFYLKLLETFLRLLAKRMGLKVIRTHILVLWSSDGYELRGDVIRVRERLITKLREAFGIVDGLNHMTSGKPLFLTLERSHIILICTKEDEALLRKHRRPEGQAWVKAVAPPSVIGST